jgi:chromosome segregation ATPase
MMEQQLINLRQQYNEECNRLRDEVWELHTQKEQLAYQLEYQKNHEAVLTGQLAAVERNLTECQQQVGLGQQNEQALFAELHRVQNEKLHIQSAKLQADAEVQRLDQEVTQLGDKLNTAHQHLQYYIQYDMQLANAFMQNAQQAQMVSVVSLDLDKDAALTLVFSY